MDYSEKVMYHFMNPRNMGEIPDATSSGTVGNPVCGDIMKIDLKIEDDIITDAKFKTFGCGSAIATSSMATELVIGKNTADALDISIKAVAEALDGLPAVKMHCSVLDEQAIKKALQSYFESEGRMTPELTEKFKILNEDDHGCCMHE